VQRSRHRFGDAPGGAVSRLALIVIVLSVGIWASSFSGAAGTTTAGPAAAGPVTRTFFAKADAGVEEANPSTNFGSLPELRVRGGATAGMESFLRFGVTGVAGPIQSAKLLLHTGSAVDDGTANGPAVFSTTTTWSETGVTWSNRPGHTSGAVDDKGPLPPDRWITYDVKSLVTGNGAHGFALATSSVNEVVFNAREAPSLRPRLVVSFLDEQPPSPPPSLSGWAPSSTSVSLTWAAASDNVGVTAYRVYRNGTLRASIGPGTTYRDTTVLPGGRYAYEVKALDAAGNESDPRKITVTTPIQRTFFPQADARVMEAKPSTNFGHLPKLRVRGGAASDLESFLRFSVTGVSGPIRSARLWLRTTSSTDAGTADGPAIYGTSSAWSEAGITWSNRPERTSAAVDDEGAIGPDTWVGYDVRSLVNGNGTFSFAFATSSADEVLFNSREAASLRPMLVLRFRPDDRLVMAAGDIACDPSDSPSPTSCRQLDTSNLLRDGNPHAVLPLGDLQYSDATLAQFTGSYDPSWGGLKGRTRPAPGNHEYKTSGAAGYFDYFNGPGNAGGRAGDRTKGYYSHDVGAWHLVALNSECSEVGGCGPGSAQEQWLRQDLARHPRACTLAYWHHPRFSSGNHGNSESTHGLWQALWEAGAEIVLSGHSHDYERFAPQNPSALHDPGHGIREFVVGTGGKNLTSFETLQPNSEARNAVTFGVLALTLRPGSYRWQFLPVAGSSFTDSGSGTCHHAPPPVPPTP
jgi:acid phosphatase type 7